MIKRTLAGYAIFCLGGVTRSGIWHEHRSGRRRRSALLLTVVVVDRNRVAPRPARRLSHPNLFEGAVEVALSVHIVIVAVSLVHGCSVGIVEMNGADLLRPAFHSLVRSPVDLVLSLPLS